MRKKILMALSAAAGGSVLLAALTMTPASADSGPAGGCTATATVQTQWGSGPSGGQVALVQVVNTSRTTSTKWTVGWTVGAGQKFAAVWNAGASVAGNEVTFVNASWNGVLAPGRSALFGVRLEGVGPVPALRCDNGVPASPSSPPISPSASPSSTSGVRTLGPGDNGSTVGLVVGQTVAVSLDSRFRPPVVSGSVLRAVSSSGGYPTGQPLNVLYRVDAAGRADITTQSDAECLHTTPPCSIPVQSWAVHVIAIG